jgi:hypothetical protein
MHTQFFSHVDAQYKELQELARKENKEQLLAQAVMWSVNDTKQMPEFADLSEEDRFVNARRALTLQTIANAQAGLHPFDLWQALVG